VSTTVTTNRRPQYPIGGHLIQGEQKFRLARLYSGVDDDRLWHEAKALCKEMGAGGGGHHRWAHLVSSGDNYATAPLTAPLTPEMSCRPAVIVTMLRMRAGLGMGWPTGATCRCRANRFTTAGHVMTCASADPYYTPYSSLQRWTTVLVRSAGATARPEPMLRDGGKDRLGHCRDLRHHGPDGRDRGGNVQGGRPEYGD
jgi:hypothetical protein